MLFCEPVCCQTVSTPDGTRDFKASLRLPIVSPYILYLKLKQYFWSGGRMIDSRLAVFPWFLLFQSFRNFPSWLCCPSGPVISSQSMSSCWSCCQEQKLLSSKSQLTSSTEFWQLSSSKSSTPMIAPQFPVSSVQSGVLLSSILRPFCSPILATPYSQIPCSPAFDSFWNITFLSSSDA